MRRAIARALIPRLRSLFKSLIFAAGLAIAPMWSEAQGKPANRASSDGEKDLRELTPIIVTGTRLQTNFDTQSPTTLATADQLKWSAPTNLADGLNQLPGFNNSTKTSNPGTAAASGDSGQNLLNLRGLGANRLLVLLNGTRLIATNYTGSVDINLVPQSAIKRVEIVAGGSSAAYGSDAISGVVNFIVDDGFEGLKASAQSGVSARGDLPSFGSSLMLGTRLTERLRLLASFEYFKELGIRASDRTGRIWFDRAAGQYPVPGTLTTVTVVPDIRSSIGAYGGLITAGPLKGTTFLPSGGLGTFDYGTSTGSSFQSGGDGPRVNIGFAPDQRRYNAFVRAEYELTDWGHAYVSALYADSHTKQGAFVIAHTGTANGFTIFRDNAFLPAALAIRMDALGLASIPVGRFSPDFPLVEIESLTRVYQLTGGLDADIGKRWKSKASVSYAQTDQQLRENNLTINRSLYAAVDAVRTASGAVVCRSTLSGLDPGCVPLNLFGLGSPSEGAIRYVTGDGVKRLRLQQLVAALDISGDLGSKFSLGAGPISLAAGLEYRNEEANQVTDALSSTTTITTGIRGAPATQNNRAGGYNFYNPLPFSGHYNIKEAYLESGLPVFSARTYAKLLNIDAAVRFESNSRTGGVIAWKVGALYEPIGGIRFRIARSRDVRGASVVELFNPVTQSSLNTLYQGRTTPTLLLLTGNPNLLPERSDTLTFGAVLSPSFAPGFRFSIDRFLVSIKDAIGSLSPQQEIDGCSTGNQFLCGLISVTPQNTLIIQAPSLNLAIQKVAGVDFELAYERSVGEAKVNLRALATWRTAAYRSVLGSTPIYSLGQPDTPRFSATFQARYQRRSWSALVQERFISASLFDANKLAGRDTNLNNTPAICYTDATVTFDVGPALARKQFFLSITNLFDRDPPVATLNPTSFSSPTSSAYDPVGRYFNAGIRLAF